MIRTTAQYEINHRLGPTKIYRAQVIIGRDEVTFIGSGKMRIGSLLCVRCFDLEGTGNFVAMAEVTRYRNKELQAKWKLLESDEVQLEEALRNAAARAA